MAARAETLEGAWALGFDGVAEVFASRIDDLVLSMELIGAVYESLR